MHTVFHFGLSHLFLKIELGIAIFARERYFFIKVKITLAGLVFEIGWMGSHSADGYLQPLSVNTRNSSKLPPN